MQVDRVLGGCDVLGRPYGKPIRFPKDPQEHAVLCTWTHGMLTHKYKRLTVAQRTAFIRKFATYMIRKGSWNGVDASLGLEWFRTHPHLLTTKISMASAIKRAHEAQGRERDDEGQRLSRMRDYARAVPCPPMPVMFRSGPYTLEKLIHPDHLLAVGREAKNCLAALHDGVPIANRFYWQLVKKEKHHVFTLRHQGRLCITFTVAEGRIRESEVFYEPDGLTDAFLQGITALRRHLGKISFLLRDVFVDRQVDFPSRTAFWLFMLPIAREIRLALGGAVPGADLAPLPLPELATRKRMLTWARNFHLTAPDCTSNERIRFARKLADFLIDNRETKLREYKILQAIGWFSIHRWSLASRTSLAEASRLEQQRRAVHLNAQLKEAQARWNADISAAPSPPNGAELPERVLHDPNQLSFGSFERDAHAA
jgi:hypothetical protein